MTGSYEMMALDLDSQIHLLSRIQFLTRFSSNLIQITGEPGAGKTWLSERYLENWAQEPVQSLLICNPTQQDAQHRAIILRQIVRDGVFNEQDPLVHSLEYMLQGQSCHALVVIDDAHRLSANLIAELWALVTEAQQNKGWQINILLFSLRGKLNKWLQKVSYGQGIKPLEMEINPLSDPEREMFIEVMMVSRRLDASQRRELKHKASLLPSLPGALKELEKQETPPMEEKKRRSLSPLILLALLLVVAGAGIIWWFVPPSGEQPAEVAGENSVIPEGVDELSAVIEKGSQAPEGQDGVAGSSSSVTEDIVALPPVVSGAGMTVGRSDDNKRIVVPDQVVDAIIDDQETGGDGTNAVAEPLIPELAANSAPAVSLQEPQPAPAPAAPRTGGTRSGVALSNTALLDISKERYALQLAALQSLEAVAQFTERYAITDKVSVYETRRNGEPWFMVLVGDFASINDARRAELGLSADVQSLGPWVKSFAQIHREIDRVN